MENVKDVITLLAILGCGLMAGVFFIFSVAIMNALSRLPASEGIAAMQAINIAIVNPLFMLVFLGTAATTIFVVVSSLLKWQEPNAIYLVVGGVLYVVGSLLVTVIINIPMNNALAAAKPTDSTSATLWANYLTNWTAWNHVRVVAAIAATVSLTIARIF
jgi:uncharacterized membrane protein